MRSFWKFANHYEEILSAILLVLTTVIVSFQVLGNLTVRLLSLASLPVFSMPPWTEELGTILFSWLVFVGAAVAMKRGEHFAVEVFADALPRRGRYAIDLFVHGLWIAFAAILIYYGTIRVQRGFAVSTPVLEIPRAYLYLAVPVGGLMILLRTLQRLIRDLRRGPSDEEGAPA